MSYVPLDRRFAILTADDLAGDPNWSAPSAGRDWADLLQDPAMRLAVILGPGGIGKTREMREQARHLRAEGWVAVFVALDQLVGRPFADALDPAKAAAFHGWDPAVSEAVFLLDAVNEAKLEKRNALNQVLKAFALAADRGAGCARVRLSCRPSDWLHRADADSVSDALQELFPSATAAAPGGGGDPYDPRLTADSPTPIPAEPPATRVAATTVRLLPLDEERIRLLAEQAPRERHRRLPRCPETNGPSASGRASTEPGMAHGILLLCMIKKRKWEIEKPDGAVDRSAGLPDLLRVLNDAATALVTSRPDIDGLTVIGIDATAWEKTGKAKAPAKPGRRAKAKTAAPAEGT